MIEYIKSYPIESLPVFLTLFPLITLTYRMSYKDLALRYFYVMLIIKLFLDFWMLYLASKGINNLIYYNAWIGISFLCLSAMLFHVIKNKLVRGIIITGYIIFCLTYVYDIHQAGFGKSLQIAPTVQCFFIIFYILSFFYELLDTLRVRNLAGYPLFWVCSGALIYYSCCLFITPIYYLFDVVEPNMNLYLLVMLPYIFESAFMLIVGIGALAGE